MAAAKTETTQKTEEQKAAALKKLLNGFDPPISKYVVALQKVAKKLKKSLTDLTERELNGAGGKASGGQWAGDKANIAYCLRKVNRPECYEQVSGDGIQMIYNALLKKAITRNAKKAKKDILTWQEDLSPLLGKIFEKYDKDRDRRLTFSEFSKALRKSLDMNMSNEAAHLVFQKLDSMESGGEHDYIIDLREFRGAFKDIYNLQGGEIEVGRYVFRQPSAPAPQVQPDATSSDLPPVAEIKVPVQHTDKKSRLDRQWPKERASALDARTVQLADEAPKAMQSDEGLRDTVDNLTQLVAGLSARLTRVESENRSLRAVLATVGKQISGFAET